MIQHDPLLVFKQYGFREVRKTSDGHAVGNCPLCGKLDHFFVNTQSDNKAWDCKKCGCSGGFKKFLESIVELGKKSFVGKAASNLSSTRGIKIDTFRMMGVGYLPASGLYTLPVWSDDMKSILNIKIYSIDKSTFQNTATCQSAVYGLWAIPKVRDVYDSVFICEGEWDALTMVEIIASTEDTRSIVLGMPGSGSFRPELLTLCVGKTVYLLYDNDDAGQMGLAKATKQLIPVAGVVKQLKWNDKDPKGYDVRDLYVKKFKCDASQTISYLFNACKPYIPSDGESVGDGAGTDVAITPASQVYKTFKKWLHMPSTSILDIIFGTIIANRLPGDPLWMFIVAPPGFTKTEPLLTLSGARGIETLSSLTPSTLISGMNNGIGDPSLIPQLNNKLLVIKDYTTILGLPETERDEIESILRDAYDGECSKPFGNGVFRKYKSKFGIIAAVTPVIEHLTEEHAALGARFLRFKQSTPTSMNSRRDYIVRALDNMAKEQEMRTELNALSKKLLLANYIKIPTCSDKMRERVIGLAQLISILRGTVHREKYTKDIIHRSYVELGTRVGKQILKLLTGVAMFRQLSEIDESCYSIAITVAKSSVVTRYVDALSFLNSGKSCSNSEVGIAMGLPPVTATIVLENLVMLGVIDKSVLANKAEWTLRSDIRQMISDCKFFSEGKVLNVTRKKTR